MRRLVTSLILSLFLLSGTGVAFADKHNDRDRKEYKHDNRRPGYGQGNHKRPGSGKDDKKRPGFGHDDKKRPGFGQGNNRPGHNHGGNSHKRPGYGQNDRYHHNRPASRPHHYAPAPPPPHHHYGPAPHPIHHNLAGMVRHATRGCHDVAVWQVDYDTYVVRYRKGNRFYTQYIYPYAGRYGSRNRISVNWSPMSPWTFIPNIQLNINL